MLMGHPTDGSARWALTRVNSPERTYSDYFSRSIKFPADDFSFLNVSVFRNEIKMKSPDSALQVPEKKRVF